MPDGRLFIVRHGESGWNRAGRVQGQSTVAPGLTEAGLQHAEAAAKFLVKHSPSLVLSSDLLRARETAAPICSRLRIPMEIEPLLRERALGVTEGGDSTSASPHETGINGEVVVDADARPSGGESLRELYDRIAALFRHLVDDGMERQIVLVTHGGPIRVARAYLAGTDVEKMTWSPIPNGSILEASFAEVKLRSATP